MKKLTLMEQESVIEQIDLVLEPKLLEFTDMTELQQYDKITPIISRCEVILQEILYIDKTLDNTKVLIRVLKLKEALYIALHKLFIYVYGLQQYKNIMKTPILKQIAPIISNATGYFLKYDYKIFYFKLHELPL